MPTTILICVQIIGLFPDAADAESYAEDHSLKDWWVARLISPDAFADRHWKRLRHRTWAPATWQVTVRPDARSLLARRRCSYGDRTNCQNWGQANSRRFHQPAARSQGHQLRSVRGLAACRPACRSKRRFLSWISDFSWLLASRSARSRSCS
jgi:hypothetical protein